MRFRLSVFPKFFKALTVHQLIDLVRETDLDTVNVTVRDGYWVTPAGLKSELPAFVKAMAGAGIRADFCTLGYPIEQLLAAPETIAILADNGIRDFRIGYFGYAKNDPAPDIRGAISKSREQLAALTRHCEKHAIRAVYQVHHGTLFTGGMAIWHALKDLPPAHLGVELDPGNQQFEGFDNWHLQAHLLKEYLIALGVKDTTLQQDQNKIKEPGKGWKRSWAPLYEGETNWHQVMQALHQIAFDGTLVFMPFYHENDPVAIRQILRQEVAYLRSVIKAEIDKSPALF